MNNDTKTYGTTTDRDANRDPLTGAPGSHPVGTAAGAVAGGAAGAAVGTAAGPVGTVVGAAVGAVVGGLAGKGIAEQIDPTVEDAYWRDNFTSRPYASGSTYDEYRPAYRYGWDSYSKYPGRRFDEVESDLSRDWDRAKGESRLTWDRAKLATKDAWNRVSDSVERAIPGDSDRDGK
nr:glycine zipper domain-containing protein [Caldimonas sp.]